MKTSLPLPALDSLNEILEYDKQSGNLIWKKSRKVAGCISRNGYTAYRRLRIDKKLYMAHRLVWLMIRGADPGLDEIDHRDGDGLNNRVSNLRKVRPSVNRRNLVRKRRNPYPTGVYYILRSQKFTATIKHDGNQKHLGMFNTMLEAYECRLRAELQVAAKTNDSVLKAKASSELRRLMRGT
jgi:hypothetical protein